MSVTVDEALAQADEMVTRALKLTREARKKIATLKAERDTARGNARILAHAYTHDSRPLQRAVDESLAYPVFPERS